MESFNLVGLLLAFFVFMALAIKAKSLGSFRFQLSIFMLLWVLAEAPHIAETLGLLSPTGYELYGLTFHMTSMLLFALFVGAKSYRFLRTPSLSLPTKSAEPHSLVPTEPITERLSHE